MATALAADIRKVKDLHGLVEYFSAKLGWSIDFDDFDEIENITYDFDAADIGLKEEAFAKISALRQLPPLVDGQRWGIFSVEFDSKRFEVTALRKILSGLIPKRRNSADHAVWEQQDLLFLCFWGEGNERTIGVAHFADKESGLPQIQMIYCAPAVEDFTQIATFENRLAKLEWPEDPSNTNLWRDKWSSAFKTAYRQTITDSSTLTIQLAVEAQGIRDRILEALEVETVNGYVHTLYDKFKNTLIHDMTEQQFADMYAQTVVYGLFSARCMDASQEDFSATEAVDCIPNTNPFLKHLMQECLGAQANSRLSFDELEIGNVVELLRHTQTEAIIQDFNRQTGGGREDPVIHFYEEFLTAYDKAQKVQRGVYYTPQPVVNFIVRAVDDLLKSEFGVVDGLASTETKKIKITRNSKKKMDGLYRSVEDTIDVPAVQVLDPATGTGTFLRQIILQIYSNYKEMAKAGLVQLEDWSHYVDHNLLPRVNGFELMMAPYAVAHMKLAMVLQDTGYDFSSNSRLNVYLTNTLEKPGASDNQMVLWDDPLATESVEANRVKKNSGINVVVGNPPYSISSANRGEWILGLLASYKEGLNERKVNLDDDYIKFIRYGQYVIGQAGQGILAYISNNSFLDGMTHRQMRYELMKEFDKIIIINLHGNSKRFEKAPDGGKDENVFDIQQGVSINLFIKSSAKVGKAKLASIYYSDLYGSRGKKYEALRDTQAIIGGMESLYPEEPYYFFVPKDFSQSAEYDDYISIPDIFSVYNSGIQTKRDKLVISFEQQRVEQILADFRTLSVESLRSKYQLPADGRDWSISGAVNDIKNNSPIITHCWYRPFDLRYTAYTGISRGFMGYPREKVFRHFIDCNNVGLIVRRNTPPVPFTHAFVCDSLISEGMLGIDPNGREYVFPLYLYPEDGFSTEMIPNINPKYAERLLDGIGYKYIDREDHPVQQSNIATPYQLLCYIYAVLYDPLYREKYGEFLKIDFPKIPAPNSPEKFRWMVSQGDRLIQLHTMQSENYEKDCYQVTFTGNDLSIEKATFGNRRIWINKTSYFEGIDAEVWSLYIGGYQPLQKWLKDRKNREITTDEIEHYKAMVAVLKSTLLIMKQIGSIER